MSLAVVYCRASVGVAAPLVTVEVHLSGGLPRFSIVGLPEAAVRESQYRVRSAIMNSHFEFPRRRITVNLAPADLPKEGCRFDLAIALGILTASEQIAKDRLSDYEFAGELALSGELRAIRGALPFALETHQSGRDLIIASGNAEEVGLATERKVYVADNLRAVCEHLWGRQALPVLSTAMPEPRQHSSSSLDLSDVNGQVWAKRALEIAAAGAHSLLFMGPPGAGKTMLAMRLPSILPTMTNEEALGVAAIYSICRMGFNPLQWRERPFRSPHHTTSSVALVGGSSPPQPGEISLAHHGVLFLDELPEFNRHVLESLREPIEGGTITISRASYRVDYPARFQLIAAMNPCPCGYLGDARGRCHCTSEQVSRYRAKLSGPLLDRIDMHVEVAALGPLTFSQQAPVSESSAQIRARVVEARKRQCSRSHCPNAHLPVSELSVFCSLAHEEKLFLEKAMSELELSTRGYHRVLKLSRTIADLEGSEKIASQHLAEALSYRVLDRIQQ